MFFFLGTTDGTTRKLKVTKLIEGHEYNFKVYAVNGIGESDPCTSTEPIKAKLPFGTFFHIIKILAITPRVKADQAKAKATRGTQ